MDFAEDLVELDRDHPGFRDAAYRARRNEIARLAIAHRVGEPAPDAPYTEAEHAVWREIWAHLAPLHQARACRGYLEAEQRLGLPRDRIPQLAEVNRWLAPHGGFSLLPVAGLVTPARFMVALGQRIFLSTQYIRHASMPLYTPEPDVVHELVGHAPSLVDDRFVALSLAFGEAARAAEEAADEPRILEMIRLYWFTLEFGVVREDGVNKAYGAGLLSSFGELGTFEERAELVPFDVARICATPFDTSDYQTTLFVAEDLDEVFDRVTADLTGSSAPRARSRPSSSP